MSTEKQYLSNSRRKIQRNKAGRQASIGQYHGKKVEAADLKLQAKKPGKEQKSFKPLDKDIMRFNNETRNITFHPVFNQWHPYPYIATPDVYLFNPEDDEDYKPLPALPEEIVERVMLDTKFTKSLVEDLINEFIESETRTTVLTFTKRQGPANKPSDSLKNISQGTLSQAAKSQPKNKKTVQSNKEDVVHEAIADDILKEEIQIQLKALLWNALDHRAIFLDDETYKILSNDNVKLLSITKEQQVTLQKHVIQVGRGLRNSSNGYYDYNIFNGMKTRNYVYQFHKAWTELMTTDNYAYRELKSKYCNEAAWYYFSKECIEATEQFMVEMDTEEIKNRNLNTYNTLTTPHSREKSPSNVPTPERTSVMQVAQSNTLKN